MSLLTNNPKVTLSVAKRRDVMDPTVQCFTHLYHTKFPLTCDEIYVFSLLEGLYFLVDLSLSVLLVYFQQQNGDVCETLMPCMQAPKCNLIIWVRPPT